MLAIGAHPDDVELGAGGTIARHTLHHDVVTFLVLSNGEKSGDPDARRSECVSSAKLLNVADVIFGELPDTRISEGIDTITVIERAITRAKPARIYTHTTKDIHQDHRNAALASISAARGVPEIYSYESPITFPNFNAQYYVNITDTLDMKVDALNLYASQNAKMYLDVDAIKGLAQFRGYQIGRYRLKGIKYAEAFEVIRRLEI